MSESNSEANAASSKTPAMKPTVANAKKLGADRFGWAGFKHKLMDELGISQAEFDRWDVPPEWQEAFKKANGR